tara:strand:- start:1526 stop:1969 length:444 start_codon:yes stop_codon:yes gene_type:complete
LACTKAVEPAVALEGKLETALYIVAPEVIPVRLAPLMAGREPVRLAADRLVKAEPLIAGNVPVRLAADRLVKAEPLIAGREPVRLAADRLVKAEPSRAGRVAGNLAAGKVPEVRADASFEAGTLSREARGTSNPPLIMSAKFLALDI